MSNNSPDNYVKLKKEYEELRPLAEHVRDEIYQKLSVLIDELHIPLATQVEARVKSWDSIVGKLNRLSLHINSLEKLNDFVGIRLVTLFRQDAISLCKLIEGNFEVISGENVQERLGIDRFGYASFHYVLGVSGLQSKMKFAHPEQLVRTEVQVRTLAQHLWAATSQVLHYKNEQSVPIPLRRSMHRTSALLEIVDLELERLYEEQHEYMEQFNGFSDDEGLSIMMLQILFTELLPKRNYVENDDYFGVMTELLHLDVNTKGKVKDLIQMRLDEALSEDRSRMEAWLADPKVPASYKEELRERGTLFSHAGLVRTMLSKEFGDRHKIFDTSSSGVATKRLTL